MSVYVEIQTATVIRYSQLWTRQAGKDETAGRKEPPVAVGMHIPRAAGDLVLFFPITTKQPEPPIGRFSKAFFLPIFREFIARRKSFSEISRHR